MAFLIGLLTFVLFLDCLVLVFLVLIQLPKKDAGAGLAFGAGATDALFGAGSGTVLTKVTKYAAGTFFVLAILLGIMQRNFSTRSTSAFERGAQQTPPAQLVPPTKGQPAPAVTPTPGTNVLLSTPQAEATNVPPPATTAPTNSATAPK
jgi:preprotein translocase subunit SecG